MRSFPAVSLLCAAATTTLSATGSSHAQAPPAPPALPALEDGTEVGAPIVSGNLALFPLLARAGAPDPDYLTLDEGMDRGAVSIKEKTDEQVSELHLTNRGKQPLFVMTGEVIIGGKQDRVISKDMIVPANQEVAIPVRCVEHGRWSGAQRSFASARAMAHTKLRKQANYKSQQDVWNEVSAKNAKRQKAAGNSTGTYRGVAVDKDVEQAVRRYRDDIDKVLAQLPTGNRMVGFAVALNGKVVAMEQFASPRLFAKVRDKLLRSYYVEALDVPAQPEARPATPADVSTFTGSEKDTAAQVVVESPSMKNEQLKAPSKTGTKLKAKTREGKEDVIYKSVYQEE
jgi:ARG/rhodanese/phosphatase superfamily protein